MALIWVVGALFVALAIGGGIAAIAVDHDDSVAKTQPDSTQATVTAPTAKEKEWTDYSIRAKLKIMKELYPSRFDVDPHGAEGYVTYKLRMRGKIYICMSVADLHEGKWFIAVDKQCGRIKQPRRKIKPLAPAPGAPEKTTAT